MSNEVWRWSAVDTAAAIRDGNVSAVEVTNAAVARMAAANGRVNAVTVDLSEEALTRAAAADAAQAAGLPLGPLHGVPVTIKENTDQKGLANANGVPAFADNIAPENAPLVDNLLRAGAIIIGRTNTPEFSLRWSTDNPLRGLTTNPWNADVTPGGSSGGAAASVALGIGAIAHGNDLGGSLRYPAYACGVATIRPSLGRVPAYNATAAEERGPSLQLMSVQGPIAREVRDVRLGLAVMAQGDPRDPWWVPAPIDGPQPPAPVRVAMTKAPAGLPCHPAVAEAIDTAGRYLEVAGYGVELVEPPLVDEIAETWRALLATDASVLMGAMVREHGSADINAIIDGFIEGGRPRDLEGYIRKLADRTRLVRAWSVFMEDYPLVLCPVSQEPPFGLHDELESEARRREILASQTMLYAINLLGLPAAAVPTGLHDGLPVGVQIVGRRFREDMCLDAAQAIESATGVLSSRLWQQLEEG